MKKAVVIGGSNGIGLALALDLIKRGYYTHVLDKAAPQEGLLPEDMSCYTRCNLLDFDPDMVRALADDPQVEVLMITAGLGRVADFEYLHPGEIETILRVNCLGAIQAIRLFYHRIKNPRPFFCGVMGSIAGWVSSPMFSVYAASKAALCRFAESVNIELEAAGLSNRILNVSPGSMVGTRFNGGENDLSLTSPLAGQILDRLFAGQTLYIPRYDETFKDVIARYQKDAHEYGLHSYQYKKESGRAVNENKARIGYLSGTFDLFHVGHLNLIRRARQECDYLIVGVHLDASHKGKETFIPYEERLQIVGACKYVDKAVQSCKEDSDAWNLWHYNKLFVGSDYKGTPRFQRYEEFFQDKGVEIVYLPYTQSTSSTQIRKTVLIKTRDIP